ncbi:DUF5916 domain-containing protein [Marinicella sp. W31]|uniref:carbohydrate binding family 9 domain-containing protein n=1 Tax=Marinicella sp. W31 TaxID=3023713 RepID=UPI003757FF43
MKKSGILALCLCACLSWKISAETYQVPSAQGEVRIDGVLDEAIWQQALEVPFQYEIFPSDNIPAETATTGYLIDLGDSLLIGFEAEDEAPEQIRAFLRDRDSAYQDDMIGVMLDTYNDQRRALEFFVNPLGVQMDLIRDGNNNEDDSWDAIWESAGIINATGYSVEIRIPYNELQMPAGTGEKTWGIVMFRAQPRDFRTQYQNSKVDRNNSCFLCQTHKFTGFASADRGRDLEITPTITAITQQSRELEDTDFDGTETDFEPGIDVNWGINSNLTLNATLNPDFSQVESDSAQLSENQTFSLFFPERRPFFLENSDFFSTPTRLIYTRNIADPDYGVRLVGKKGKNAYGFFYADDTLTNLLIPGVFGSSFTSLDLESENLVGRYRRDFGEASTIGTAITHRSGTGYSNRVLSIDGDYRISDTDTLRFQYGDSSTEYPLDVAEEFDQPIDRFDGNFYLLRYRHRGENWRFNVTHEDTEDGFRADTGFFRQVGVRRSIIGAGYQWYGNDNTWWNRINAYSDWDITHDQDGRLVEKEFEGNVNMRGPKQSFFIVGGGVRDRLWDDILFREDYLFTEVEFQPMSGLEMGAGVTIGDSVDFSNSLLGDRVNSFFYVEANMGKHLSVDAEHSFTRLKRDGGDVFLANQTDVRLSYQFNIRQRLRLALIRTNIQRDLVLYEDPEDVNASDESISTQLIYSYKVNPRTLLFLGYSDFGLNNDDVDSFTRTNKTLFAKFSYAFKY